MTYNLTRHPIRLILSLMMMSIIALNMGTLSAQSLSIVSPTSAATVNATQYEYFELEIDIDGGVPSYVLDSATGLPSNFSASIDDDGNGATIIGVTSDTGTFSVTIEVSDSNPDGAETASVTFDIEVAAVAANTIEINVPDVFELTDGVVDESYSAIQFSTADDSVEACYTWSIDSDDLPPGIAFSEGDVSILGTSTTSGVFDFTVNVNDNSCDDDVKEDGARLYRITVTGSSSSDLQISSPTSSSLPNGVLGNAYAVDVDATGGNGAYVFTATGLPGGLVVTSSTGLITGTPSVAGTFNVKVTVEDADEDTASRDYTLTISETGDAVYGSSPSPGSTIDFGSVTIGSSFTVDLVVSEEGEDDLDVSQPSGGLITGSDSSNFAITSSSPPFTIDDGGDDVTVQVRCTPDSEDSFNAVLQFTTNDEDRLTVVYSLFCTGVVTGGNEDSDSTTGDTTDDADTSTATPSIPTQTPLPPTYANVIEVQGLSLRTAPFIGASRRDVLRRDIPYRVTAKSNQEGVYMWYYIITDDGKEGWASGRYLAVYGQDVPFAGSVMDNVWDEQDRGVRVQALDNLNFRPAPSDRTQPYVDLIPWGGIMRVFARTVSGRGDEWYAVQYNGINGWVYAPNTKVIEGLMEAIDKF
jgi:hypothetical protein